jgi:hypothetical protein
MVTDLVRKKVLILSDNAGLSRAIELNLSNHLDVETIKLGSGSSKRNRGGTEMNDFDLMVVAMSSPSSEPVVALARASLTKYIGRIPMLIISDRPFDSKPGERIIHLDFPFDIEGLYDKVEEILEA